MTEENKPLHISEQLFKKSWDELQAIENNDRVLFPDHIKKRKADGTVDRVDVMFQVPREPDHRAAKIKARTIGIKEGFDLDRDKDVFEQLENICLLSICIRNKTHPYEPWEPDPLALEKKYDSSSLSAAYDAMDCYAGMIDPRPDDLSEMDCWSLVAAMAKAKNTYPLLVCGRDSQSTLVLFMADQLANSQAYKSWLELQEESIQTEFPFNDSKKS